MRVLCLDLSLTRTGVADSAAPSRPYVLAPPSKVGRSWGRIHWFRQRVQKILIGADLLVCEGYAYHSATNAVAAGELGGVVKYLAYCMGVPVVDIAPATLKKVATGRGNAKKGAVLAEAIRRLGYTGHDDNEADALFLLQAAAQHYDLPCKIDLPKSHTSTLGKVAWPALEGMVAA